MKIDKPGLTVLIVAAVTFGVFAMWGIDLSVSIDAARAHEETHRAAYIVALESRLRSLGVDPVTVEGELLVRERAAR